MLATLFKSVKKTIVSSVKEVIVHCVPSIVEPRSLCDQLFDESDDFMTPTFKKHPIVVTARCASQAMVALGYWCAEKRPFDVQDYNVDFGFYFSNEEDDFENINYWSPEDAARVLREKKKRDYSTYLEFAANAKKLPLSDKLKAELNKMAFDLNIPKHLQSC